MPAQEYQSALSFVETKISVDGQPILFSNLSVHEYLADAGSFSFLWRQPHNAYGINDHIKFYGKNLGAKVDITIGDSFKFSGIIFAINCSHQNDLGIEYEISGKGLPATLQEITTCDSWLKMKLQDIAKAVLDQGGIKAAINPEFSEVIYYTVQYNQSGFDFLKMLAARYGEWFYYDGSQLKMGKPENGEVSLVIESTMHDWQISGKMLKSKSEMVSTDTFSGISLSIQESLTGLKGMLKTVTDAGDKSIGGEIKKHSTKNVQDKLLKSLNKIQLQGDLANSVFVSGSSYAVGVRLCTLIDVRLPEGTEQGKYRITEVHHRSYDGTDYQNTFTAIPMEAEKPPYTNTELYPVAMAQPAEVTHNEDKDGLDRVKVKFPWHGDGENENTPWISMVQTHAGKNKGFRFLPEIGDKVMVGFLDDNAERPYVLGALYNENEKSGIEKEKINKNEQKFIGTKTGRRLLWDEGEKEELFSLDDNVFDFPANKLIFNRKDKDQSIKIESSTSKNNGSIIQMNNEKTLEIGMVSGGKLIAKIIFDSKEPKITIESDDLIELKSKKKITIGAPEIEITAQNKLTLECTAKTEINGNIVKIEAKGQLEAKGTKATFEGVGMAEFKAGGVATLKGGVVMIN
jgi:type VI secretion system secreted protein VgrG